MTLTHIFIGSEVLCFAVKKKDLLLSLFIHIPHVKQLGRIFTLTFM